MKGSYREWSPTDPPVVTNRLPRGHQETHLWSPTDPPVVTNKPPVVTNRPPMVTNRPTRGHQQTPLWRVCKGRFRNSKERIRFQEGNASSEIDEVGGNILLFISF